MRLAAASKLKSVLAVLAASVLAATMLSSPAVSDEHEPTPPFDVVIPCDYTSDDVPEDVILVFCLQLRLDRGDASFGSIDASFEGPIVVQLDVGVNNAFEIVELGGGDNGNGNGGGGDDGLSFPPIVVPGGLLGALGLDLPDELVDLIDPVNGVSAEVQPLGDLATGDVDLAAFLAGDGVLTTVNIPLRVQIHNLLLGDTCYIGSADDPIDLNLDLELSGGYQFDEDDPEPTTGWAQLQAADEEFGVPGARDCGIAGTGALLNSLGLEDLNVFDQIINSSTGLPSPSGNNHLIFDGWFGLTAAQL